MAAYTEIPAMILLSGLIVGGTMLLIAAAIPIVIGMVDGFTDEYQDQMAVPVPTPTRG